mmetsp:Transcript_3923/g.6331  ORF Transcript_3923/g.6331 Transcript_3923/m.6331 type:complete len:223 (-) Transcript_3923:23-691(-)
MYSLLGRAWLVHAQCVYASAAPVTDGDEIFKVDFVAVAFGAESTRFPMCFFHDFLERLMEPQGRLVCVVLLTVVDDGVVDNEIQILLNQGETHVGPFITVSLFSEGDVDIAALLLLHFLKTHDFSVPRSFRVVVSSDLVSIVARCCNGIDGGFKKLVMATQPFAYLTNEFARLHTHLAGFLASNNNLSLSKILLLASRRHCWLIIILRTLRRRKPASLVVFC